MADATLTDTQSAIRGAWINEMRRALERGELKVQLKGDAQRTFASARSCALELAAMRAAARARGRRAWIQFVRKFGIYAPGERLQLDLVSAADVVFTGCAVFLDDHGLPVHAAAAP